MTLQKSRGRVADFNFNGLEMITESVKGNGNELIESINAATKAIYDFSGAVGILQDGRHVNKN